MPIITHGGNSYNIPLDILEKYRIKRKNYEVYSQRDPRWKNIKLGDGNTTIGSHGCFLTCLSMMAQIEPPVTNEILKRHGGFYKDLIISTKAADALGLKYYGKDTKIARMPDWSPVIKEVDMSPAPGKQQHFVLRIIDKDKKESSKYGTLIIDPWTGEYQKINYYPFVSYRLFKKP